MPRPRAAWGGLAGSRRKPAGAAIRLWSPPAAGLVRHTKSASLRATGGGCPGTKAPACAPGQRQAWCVTRLPQPRSCASTRAFLREGMVLSATVRDASFPNKQHFTSFSPLVCHRTAQTPAECCRAPGAGLFGSAILQARWVMTGDGCCSEVLSFKNTSAFPARGGGEVPPGAPLAQTKRLTTQSSASALN